MMVELKLQLNDVCQHVNTTIALVAFNIPFYAVSIPSSIYPGFQDALSPAALR